MRKDKRKRLYKKRMAMLLAVVLTLTGVVPAGAAETVDVPVSVNETASGEMTVSAPETVSPEDAVEAGEPEQEPVSGDGTVSDETVPADETASDNDTGDTGSVSENVSGDGISADAVSEDNAKGPEDGPADVTIMYYIVGSDLERRNVQATKDIMEIMTGMYWAENAGVYDPEFGSKVNVIAETGGLSFRGNDFETEDQKRKAYQSAHAELKSYIAASKNDTKIYNAIEGKIAWEKNERWVLSGTSIEKAKNDENMDRDRVMSHYKSTGDAPELEDFIVTTAKAYPAKNYMLVLWDHGGGPEGGYAGDERADSKENGYITSEQLSKTLSDASVKIRESGQDDNGDTLQSGAVSVNAGFEKFAFLGFDACLMGNLETAMAVTPYADYLFASEDLESGTGWDHRGYVKTLVETPVEGYEKDSIGETTRNIGRRMADDMMAWYENEDDTDTISVISLNEAMMTNLDEKIGALADKVVYWMLAGNNGVFDAYNYPKFLNALQKSIHFNGNTSGMLDLYSLCTEIISINDVPDQVKTAAIDVQKAIRPYGFVHDNASDTNHGPVIYESYTSHYPFVKYIEADDENKEKLGGLTVFFPHDEFRYKTEAGKTVDFLKSYLDIYYNTDGSKGIKDANKLGDGYRSLLETFCTIQTVGAAMEEGFDKEDKAVQDEMKEAAAAVKADYKLSEGSIACKTADNMTVSDGLVRNRITVSDVSMKTVVSDGSLLYVYDVANVSKKDMITKITSQMTFTDDSGKIHRLGYLPDTNEAEALNDSEKYRFIPKNRGLSQWFFMGDVPAAVYSVENLSKNGDQVFFDALDPENPVLVQIPAVIRKPILDNNGNPTSSFSDVVVILEAEVGSNSQNVIPRGYYEINFDQKQLFGFVPWDGVSDNALFWALSDVTEHVVGDISDYEEDNLDTVYGSAMKKDEVSINRGRTVEESGVKLRYIIQDVFGGKYELDSLYTGEKVDVSLTLQKNGKPVSTDTIDSITQGEEGIYPHYEYKKSEYSLSLNKDLPVGYRDAAGSFHELKTSADFKALKPGTYDIVFKNCDYEKYVITPEDGTTVSAEGVSGSIDPALYCFVPQYSPCLTLTVYDKASPLAISKKADMPYGFAKTLKPVEDMLNFVTVKNGDGDVTKSYYTIFNISVNGQTYNLNDEGGLKSFRNLDLAPGTKITVSADFYAGEDELHCPSSVELTIVRQPVKMIGVNRMSSLEYINDNVFWDHAYGVSTEGYKPEVKILMQYGGRVYEGEDRSFGKYIGQNPVDIAKLISENTVSTAIIDTGALNGAGLYMDLPIGPKLEGKKRPGLWGPGDFVADFSKYYIIEDYDDAVLKEYEVFPASKTTFRSLKGTDDDEEIVPEIYTGNDESTLEDGLWSLSDNVIRTKGDAVRQWYVRIGNDKRVPVWIDGEPILYYDYVLDQEKQLVISENGAWRLYIPRSASSNTVCFYAGYEENSTTFDETTKGDRFNITADYVMPVEYTGRPVVTTSSTKSNASKTIVLTLRDASGNTLTEGTDYTVSYKNNKNAAGPADAKAPTINVKGKGDFKGFKGEVRFTILPADLYYAKVSVSRKFAPFTSSGKLSAKVSVKLPSGVTVPTANYSILYYDEDDNEITKDRMKEFYKGNENIPVEIVVKGKKSTKRSAANNYRAGSTAESLYVTGYPKKSKKLVVKLKQKKQAFEAGKPVKAQELAKTVLKSVKIGKKNVDPADLKEVTAYYDSQLTKPAAENGTVMDRAGNYYLAFELKDEKKGRNDPLYPAFSATAVKYTLTGPKIKKGKTKLEKSPLEFRGPGNNVSLNVVFDRSKVKAEEFYLTYTTRDCSTGGGTVGYKKNAVNGVDYDFYIDDNGKLFINTIDNGAKGSYKLNFEGRGAYTGKFTLTYKVK